MNCTTNAINMSSCTSSSLVHTQYNTTQHTRLETGLVHIAELDCAQMVACASSETTKQNNQHKHNTTQHTTTPDHTTPHEYPTATTFTSRKPKQQNITQTRSKNTAAITDSSHTTCTHICTHNTDQPILFLFTQTLALARPSPAQTQTQPTLALTPSTHFAPLTHMPHNTLLASQSFLHSPSSPQARDSWTLARPTDSTMHLQCQRRTNAPHALATSIPTACEQSPRARARPLRGAGIDTNLSIALTPGRHLFEPLL
jgi:hypothetical protein